MFVVWSSGSTRNWHNYSTNPKPCFPFCVNIILYVCYVLCITIISYNVMWLWSGVLRWPGPRDAWLSPTLLGRHIASFTDCIWLPYKVRDILFYRKPLYSFPFWDTKLYLDMQSVHKASVIST